MARIDDLVEVRLWTTAARFARMAKPAYALTDLPYTEGSEHAGSAADPLRQALRPAPVRIPRPIRLQEGQSAAYDAELALASAKGTVIEPAMFLTILSGSYGPRLLPIWGTSPDPALGLGIADRLPGAPDAGGSILLVTQEQTLEATFVTATCRPAGPEAHVTAYCRVGLAEDTRWYRVRKFAYGAHEVSVLEGTGPLTGGGWKALEKIPASRSADGTRETPETGSGTVALAVEFRLAAGVLTVRVDDMGRAYAYPEGRVGADGEVIGSIKGTALGAAEVLGASFTGGELRPEATATALRPEVRRDVDLEGRTSGPAEAIFDAVGAGGTAELVQDSDGSVRVEVTMSGPPIGEYGGADYADVSGGLRGVTFFWPGEEVYRPEPPVFPLAELVTTAYRFDAASLTIRGAMRATFNGTRDRAFPDGFVGSWGEWLLRRGQMAAEVWGTRSLPSTGRYGPPTRVWTGFANTQTEVQAAGGRFEATMTGADRSVQLMTPRWQYPWMDGWNAFYAIYYLAQLGGVAPRDIAFMDLVPSRPFGPGTDLGDGEGGPAYYLPVGTDGAVIGRFAGAQLWALMVRIAQSIGFCLFFDAEGRLQFRRFAVPGGIKRVFTESDPESPSGDTGCWALSVAKTMADVRTDAVVVGFDPYAQRETAFLAKASDLASIEDPLAFNHLGYRHPAVWADSLFANGRFAEEAALAMHRFLRLPGLELTMTTWLQPDIYPLDVVAVRSRRSGVDGVPLMVTGVSHTFRKDGPASTTISARLVPE